MTRKRGRIESDIDAISSIMKWAGVGLAFWVLVSLVVALVRLT